MGNEQDEWSLKVKPRVSYDIVIPCTCPDAFVVTLADIANTSKATQHGKTQDTVPLGSGADVRVVVPRVLSDASLPDRRRSHLGAQVERALEALVTDD